MRFIIPAALVGIAVAPALPAHAAPQFAPHRAVYDLNLLEASDRSGITGISGRMVYEFDGSACEGYTVNFRFVTRIDTREVSRLTDQQTTTYEDAKGEKFSFVTKSFVDQRPESEVRGSATTGPEGTTVELEKPENATYELQPTNFPTRHLFELFEKIDQGENFYETTLFDGSEDADKVLTTTVVIGKPAPPADASPEKAAMEELGNDESWPIDIAYFDGQEGGGEELPVYRIGFKLHRNGVTRDLEMDYGEFSMSGRLVDLALSEPPDTDCEADR